MQITKIFLASFCLLLITVGANASPTNLTRRADNPALSQTDADVFLQQLNTEIKEIFDGKQLTNSRCLTRLHTSRPLSKLVTVVSLGRSSDPGKDELRRRLLELPDLKFYFSSLINDIKEIVDSFTPIKDFLSQAGYATAYAEVLLQCSEQNIRDGNWVSCVSHQLSFAARLGLESGCYFLSQTRKYFDVECPHQYNSIDKLLSSFSGLSYTERSLRLRSGLFGCLD
ncbi:hypothetical protein BKA69DRAFT_269799 [Paraphysoderma sedebokerense]|nr:hypothetical protein BKA69DRAFT_269799 [Paraphysoderma sedebokerense]